MWSCLECGNVVPEAQSLNELRVEDFSSSSDENEDESDEGQ